MEDVNKKGNQQEKVDLRGTALFVGILGLLLGGGMIGAMYLFTSRGLTFLAL